MMFLRLFWCISVYFQVFRTYFCRFGSFRRIPELTVIRFLVHKIWTLEINIFKNQKISRHNIRNHKKTKIVKIHIRFLKFKNHLYFSSSPLNLSGIAWKTNSAQLFKVVLYIYLLIFCSLFNVQKSLVFVNQDTDDSDLLSHARISGFSVSVRMFDLLFRGVLDAGRSQTTA